MSSLDLYPENNTDEKEPKIYTRRRLIDGLEDTHSKETSSPKLAHKLNKIIIKIPVTLWRYRQHNSKMYMEGKGIGRTKILEESRVEGNISSNFKSCFGCAVITTE